MLLSNYKIKLKSFFESIFYLILLSILTIINYQFNLGLLTYSIACILISLMLFTKSNFTSLPSIFIFILAGGVTTPPTYKSFGFILTCIFALIMLVTLIYYIIKNAKTIFIKCFSNLSFLTTLLLMIIMILSIITSVKPLTTLAAIGGFSVNIILMIIILATVEINEESKEKISYSFIAIFYTILVMIIFKTINLLQEYSINEILYDKKLFHLGWDYSNHYLCMMNIGALAGIYLVLNNFKQIIIYKYFLYLFPVISIPFISLILSSRASLLGLVFSLGLMFVIFLIKNFNFKWVKISTIIILGIGLLFIVLLISNEKIRDMIQSFGRFDNLLNGRTEIWNVAMSHFKEHPILGSGYGTQLYYLKLEIPWDCYNYHNYFFQITTCGILGIIAFTIYLLNIFYHLIKKNQSYFDIFISGVFIMFLTTGFFDTMFFSNKIMPLFSIIICFLDKKSIENKIEDKLLLKYELIDNN